MRKTKILHPLSFLLVSSLSGTQFRLLFIFVPCQSFKWSLGWFHKWAHLNMHQGSTCFLFVIGIQYIFKKTKNNTNLVWKLSLLILTCSALYIFSFPWQSTEHRNVRNDSEVCPPGGRWLDEISGRYDQFQLKRGWGGLCGGLPMVCCT